MKPLAVREFRDEDMAWILPIARAVGEEDGTINAYRESWQAWVVEGKCLIALFPDPHGWIVAGLTDRAGIRALLKLGRMMLEAAKDRSFLFHNHNVVEGSWQEKFFKQLGFVRHNGAMWLEE